MLEIQAHIQAITEDTSLYEERNFDKRMEAIDFIEFHIIDRIEAEPQRKKDEYSQLFLLKKRAEKLKTVLEEINTNLFETLRKRISVGECVGEELRREIRAYVYFSTNDNENQQEPGYDNFDIFINGLLSVNPMPLQTKALEPEMVFYQKTPVRIIFELVKHVVKDDVFFDLGSGLGQVAILVNLLTGITTKGVELEPAFCDYASECAKKLNLSDVTFINADAREANYTGGTIFFMYTPFKGGMLQDVLEKLRKESLQRKITIITYGPCTADIALQNWLSLADTENAHIYKLAVFTSIKKAFRQF